MLMSSPRNETSQVAIPGPRVPLRVFEIHTDLRHGNVRVPILQTLAFLRDKGCRPIDQQATPIVRGAMLSTDSLCKEDVICPPRKGVQVTMALGHS